MNRFVRLIPALLIATGAHGFAQQEITLEEIRVEAKIDFRLEPPSAPAVRFLVDELTARADLRRATELRVANQSSLTTLLDLSRFIPIPLGASDNRVDTFFLQNYTRADLNPREPNPLFSPERVKVEH